MGGTIGLCLGGSLLTLFEVVDLLIFVYFVKTKSRVASLNSFEGNSGKFLIQNSNFRDLSKFLACIIMSIILICINSKPYYFSDRYLLYPFIFMPN